MVKKTAKRWDLQKCEYHVCTLEGQPVRWLLAAFLDPALSKESTKLQPQKSTSKSHASKPPIFGLFSQHLETLLTKNTPMFPTEPFPNPSNQKRELDVLPLGNSSWLPHKNRSSKSQKSSESRHFRRWREHIFVGPKKNAQPNGQFACAGCLRFSGTSGMASGQKKKAHLEILEAKF